MILKDARLLFSSFSFTGISSVNPACLSEDARSQANTHRQAGFAELIPCEPSDGACLRAARKQVCNGAVYEFCKRLLTYTKNKMRNPYCITFRINVNNNINVKHNELHRLQK
jgi:hypothetical protein